MDNKQQFLDNLMQKSLAEVIAMLGKKGGAEIEVEVEPMEDEEEEKAPLARRGRNGKNGRLGPIRSQRMSSKGYQRGGDDDDESSMGLCCGFDDYDHIGSSYS